MRRTLFLAALLVFAVLPLLFAPLPYQFTIIVSIGLAGLAVSVLLRAGLISFGHGLYYAVGAYAVAYLARIPGMGALALLAAGSIVATLCALGTGLFVVRYRGIFFAMLNLALSMVAYTVLLKFYNLTGGSDGMPVAVASMLGRRLAPPTFGYALFYASLALALLCGAATTRYLRAPPGWALSAIRNCEIRVEYLGVSARAVLLAAYGLSGFLAGLGGAISALAVGHVGPELSYWTTSAEFLVVGVLGGIGSALGPFVGALLYQSISVSAAQYISYTWGMLLGVVILAAIRFAPGGLWGLYDRFWARKEIRWPSRS